MEQDDQIRAIDQALHENMTPRQWSEFYQSFMPVPEEDDIERDRRPGKVGESVHSAGYTAKIERPELDINGKPIH